MAAACSSNPPTLGEQALAQGAETAEFGKKWNLGTEMVEDGQKKIKKGKEQIEDGNDSVDEGKQLISKGNKIIAEAEAAIKARQLAAPAPGVRQ